MKCGLVLEGGAMRGMFTAGVLDCFMNNNIHFDAVIGTSAGAIFGANYISNQVGRVIRYSKRFNPDKNYMGLGNLLTTGNVVNTDFAYYKVPTELDIFDDDAFMKSKTDFYAVMTNISDGKAEYTKIDSVFEKMEHLRASASMPFLSKPVRINNELYLDGGISDSIPYQRLIDMKYDKIVVVLTRDLSYVKKPIPPLLVRLFYHKYPNLQQAIINRHIVYNDCINKIKELEGKGKLFVIRPSEPILIKKIERNPEKLQYVYDLGRRDADSVIDEIKNYLTHQGAIYEN